MARLRSIFCAYLAGARPMRKVVWKQRSVQTLPYRSRIPAGACAIEESVVTVEIKTTRKKRGTYTPTECLTSTSCHTHLYEAGAAGALSRAVARGVRLVVAQGFRVVNLGETEGSIRIEEERKNVRGFNTQQQWQQQQQQQQQQQMFGDARCHSAS